ncbi:MAG: hypothetical protein AAGG48_29520 [Planctomycetota bacterium]
MQAGIAMSIVFTLLICDASYPPIDPKLDSSWKRSVDRRRKGDWSLNIWHRSNEDELVIALLSKPIKFEFENEAEEIIEFATSANPVWIDRKRFPAIGFTGVMQPRFLKAATEKLDLKGGTPAGIGADTFSYAMVSENDEDSLYGRW